MDSKIQTEDVLLGPHSRSGKRMWSYLSVAGAQKEQTKTEDDWTPGKTEVLSALGPIKTIRESYL